MSSKVAVVKLNKDFQGCFQRALKLIGEIDDLNSSRRNVVIKVGVFDHRSEHHTTIPVLGALVNSFNRAPTVFVVESDNYRGTGSERLQIWRGVFTERVVPFNLSEDKETRRVKIADEEINLSHILFKPNVFVSTHVLRSYDRGSVLKNLLGLIPDRKKVRFHKKLEATLLDAYEAVGGIDLAVLDGTRAYLGVAPGAKAISSNIVLLGRDAVAVEAVGASLAGLKPEKMPVLREAVKRGLGEGDMDNIKIVGDPIRSLQEKTRSKKK